MPTRPAPPLRDHTAALNREAHHVAVCRSYADFTLAHMEPLCDLALDRVPYDPEAFDYHYRMISVAGNVCEEALNQVWPRSCRAAVVARFTDGRPELALAEHALANSRTPAEKAANEALRNGAYVRHAVLSAAAAVRKCRRELAAMSVTCSIY